MANIKIPSLPAATALSGGEVFELVQGGASKKATADQIIAYADSGNLPKVQSDLNQRAFSGGSIHSNGLTVLRDPYDALGFQGRVTTLSMDINIPDTVATSTLLSVKTNDSLNGANFIILDTGLLQIQLKQDGLGVPHKVFDDTFDFRGKGWQTIVFVVDATDPANVTIDHFRNGSAEVLTAGTPTGVYGEATGQVLTISGRNGVAAEGPVQTRNFRIFNRALTAEEVADLYKTNVIPEADRWGNVNDLLPQLNSGWYNQLGASWDNFIANLSSGFTASSAGGKSVDARISFKNSAIPVGRNVYIEFDVTAFAANGPLYLQPFQWVISSGYNNLVTITGTGTYQVITRNDFRVLGDHILRFFSTDATVLTVENFKIIPIGCLASLPLDDGPRQFRDQSPNAYHALASETGVMPLIPQNGGWITAKDVALTNGTYLLESSDILPPDAVVDRILIGTAALPIAPTQQNLGYRRIRINYDGADLIIIERSDGTTHAALNAAYTVAGTPDIKLHWTRQP